MTDLTGKHGLIVGVANKRSIAWAIADAASRAGARLAVTYQGERLEENVRDLSSTLDRPLIRPCDVTDDAQIASVFTRMPCGPHSMAMALVIPSSACLLAQ